METKKNVLMNCVILFVFIANSLILYAQEYSSQYFEKVYKNISDFDSSFVRESVYLHTGKNIFETGETLWFTAYVTDFSGQALNINRNLYVDLFNPEGEIVLQKLLYVNDKGMSAGFMKLTDSLCGGDYYLSAYTSTQRNFSKNFLFTKAIKIYNPVVNYFTPEYLKKLRKLKRQKKRIQLAYNFNGNILLADTKNILTLRVTDKLGFPEEADITVKNLTNKHEITLKTSKDGFAYVSMFVEPQSRYKITAIGESRKTRITTETALSYAIKIENVFDENENFRIKIINKLRKTNDSLARTFSVICRIPGKVAASKFFYVGNNEETIIRIPKDEKISGLLDFILLDYSGNVISNYNFFLNTESVIPQLHTRIENDSFYVRFSSKNLDRLSAFVIMRNSEIFESENTDVKHFFLFNNRLNNFVNTNEHASLIKAYSNNNESILNSYNLFSKVVAKEFFPKSSISLSGTLNRSVMDLPVKDRQIELSVLNKHFDIFVQRTDKNGRFFFDNLNYKDTIRLKFNATNDKGKSAFVINIDGDSLPYFKPFYFNENIKEKIKNTKKGRMYYIENKEDIIDKSKDRDSDKIHLHADRIIYFDKINTTAYQSTLQIISNYVPGVRTGGMSTLRGVTSLTQSSEPLYLLNGVPVDKYAVDDLPPNDVERVEILKSGANTAIYGSRGGNGVIAVFTKKGFFTTPGKLDINILGYAQMKPFFRSDISNPKISQIFHFEPEIKLSGSAHYEFSFPKNNVLDSIEINIQGFSKNGKPVSIIRELKLSR